jgi:hypothetical protein
MINYKSKIEIISVLLARGDRKEIHRKKLININGTPLLRARLQFKQTGGLLSHPERHFGSFTAFLKTLGRSGTVLFWPVTFKGPIARKLPADGRFMAIKQLADFSWIVSSFHKGLDWISYNLAEMFVVHGQLRLAGQEALNAKRSHPPSL